MKTIHEFLNDNIQFRQHITDRNYSCVGIPYEDAVKAANQFSDQNTTELIECLKELSYLRSSKLAGVKLSDAEEHIEIELWNKAKELISKYEK